MEKVVGFWTQGHFYTKEQNKEKVFFSLPLVLKSSQRTISWRSSGGDLSKTVCTVLNNVDQPSSWKMIITLADGSLEGYLLFLHLRKEKQFFNMYNCNYNSIILYMKHRTREVYVDTAFYLLSILNSSSHCIWAFPVL